MSCRFAIVLDSSKGFERRAALLCIALEADGWKSNRTQSDRIVMTSRKNHHIFRDEVELKKQLLNYLTREDLKFLTVVKV